MVIPVTWHRVAERSYDDRDLFYAMMWMGVLCHYYPVLTNRTLDNKLDNKFCWLFSIDTIGAAVVMLAAEADGMPRRHAD